jgi:ketosteroid isomerase-like protein
MRFIIILLLVLSSCRSQAPEEAEDIARVALQEIQQADVDFSNFSKEHGMRKAFMQYIDDDGILMRDNSLPIIGANAIDFLTSMNDSSIQLTWEPRGGDIAASGDLGYTYGIYELKDSVNLQKGTYVTIWKKQPDGKWKFVLDSGNQGIGD